MSNLDGINSFNQTPNANRLHIAIFGKRNQGKSSLINALTGQSTALVSPIPGTTTDPVYKAMEMSPIGPCVFIDTPGFDDDGSLGTLRVEKTRQAIDKADIAILVFSDEDFSCDAGWVKELKLKKIPLIGVINKIDALKEKTIREMEENIKKEFGIEALRVSAEQGLGIEAIKEELSRLLPEDYGVQSITGHLVQPSDVVLLVMPQDIQAPKGRLILPQVQTIRDLLDQKCIVVSTSADQIDSALKTLKQPPKLIITDSQVFPLVYEKKPTESLLTSFSVLFAAYKGDIKAFVEGAQALDHLTEQSKILIAEACTHAPLSEDIGRVKIPMMLRRKVGDGITVDIVSGNSPVFQKNMDYDLIIHCGACMFNRKHVLSRIEKAKAQGIPITNYGVAIAKLTGILDKIYF